MSDFDELAELMAANPMAESDVPRSDGTERSARTREILMAATNDTTLQAGDDYLDIDATTIRPDETVGVPSLADQRQRRRRLAVPLAAAAAAVGLIGVANVLGGNDGPSDDGVLMQGGGPVDSQSYEITLTADGPFILDGLVAEGAVRIQTFERDLAGDTRTTLRAADADGNDLGTAAVGASDLVDADDRLFTQNLADAPDPQTGAAEVQWIEIDLGGADPRAFGLAPALAGVTLQLEASAFLEQSGFPEVAAALGSDGTFGPISVELEPGTATGEFPLETWLYRFLWRPVHGDSNAPIPVEFSGRVVNGELADLTVADLAASGPSVRIAATHAPDLDVVPPDEIARVESLVPPVDQPAARANFEVVTAAGATLADIDLSEVDPSCRSAVATLLPHPNLVTCLTETGSDETAATVAELLPDTEAAIEMDLDAAAQQAIDAGVPVAFIAVDASPRDAAPQVTTSSGAVEEPASAEPEAAGPDGEQEG